MNVKCRGVASRSYGNADSLFSGPGNDMKPRFYRVSLLASLLLTQTLCARVPQAVSAELRPETEQGFERYVKATESRIQKEVSHPEGFLYIEELPEPRRSQIRGS